MFLHPVNLVYGHDVCMFKQLLRQDHAYSTLSLWYD
jgi:hypothetical protein